MPERLRAQTNKIRGGGGGALALGAPRASYATVLIAKLYCFIFVPPGNYSVNMHTAKQKKRALNRMYYQVLYSQTYFKASVCSIASKRLVRKVLYSILHDSLMY